jgi:hypothetical protein
MFNTQSKVKSKALLPLPDYSVVICLKQAEVILLLLGFIVPQAGMTNRTVRMLPRNGINHRMGHAPGNNHHN